MTFVNTGVPDIGCEDYDMNVHIRKPKPRSSLNIKDRRRSSQMSSDGSVNTEHIVSLKLTISLLLKLTLSDNFNR